MQQAQEEIVFLINQHALPRFELSDAYKEYADPPTRNRH